MVKVQITKTQNDIIIKMEGHSNFGKKGNDIVCAGISAVFQFMIIHIFNNLKLEGEFGLNSGKGYIRTTRTSEVDKIINSYEEFLQTLEKSYPNSVKVEKLRY
ncbi:MAG: ribosomal-processing cysteine protease Prp [Brevinematia bacterium]